MHVKLKRDWFGPDAMRYRSKDRTGSLFLRELPDYLLDALPSDAEVYDDNGKLLGTAKDVREGKPAPEPVEKKDEAKAKFLEKVKKAVEAAQKAVDADASDANVKRLNEAKAALAKLEKE